MLTTGHGEVNRNSTWHSSRGAFVFYLAGVTVLHTLLLCVPFLSVDLAWTLTNLIHNMTSFVFMHVLKGTPWTLQDQGKARQLTAWEQIDYGKQMTRTRRLLTVVPCVLFILACFYTRYERHHLFVNFVSLLSVLLPKLPMFHLVRVFGINRY